MTACYSEIWADVMYGFLWMNGEDAMIKKISEMTDADKQKYLEGCKKALEKEQGIPWAVIEKRMLDDIDATFDDEKFARMDPDFAIDAAYARKEFGKNKPSLVDYMLWMGKFVTHSEYVEF